MSISVPPVAPISADGYEFQTVFGEALFNALAPWGSLHLAWYCDAIGAAADPWYTMVIDRGVDDGTTPTVGTSVDGELVSDGYACGYSDMLTRASCPSLLRPIWGSSLAFSFRRVWMTLRRSR